MRYNKSMIEIAAAVAHHYCSNQYTFQRDADLIWLSEQVVGKPRVVIRAKMRSILFTMNSYSDCCDELLSSWIQYCINIGNIGYTSVMRGRLLDLIRRCHTFYSQQQDLQRMMFLVLESANRGTYTIGEVIGCNDDVATVLKGIYFPRSFEQANPPIHDLLFTISPLGTGVAGETLFKKLAGDADMLRRSSALTHHNRDVIALSAWYKGESAMLAKLAAC